MTDSLQRLVSHWALSEVLPLADTHSSKVFTAEYQGIPVVLKIMKPASDEQQSARILHYFDGLGAVRVIRDLREAMLLEKLDPEPHLKAMVQQEQDLEAAAIISNTISALHTKRETKRPDGIRTLEVQFTELFDKARTPCAPSFHNAAGIARRLLSSEQELCVLHGDIHHENILNSERGWLAIDPKGIFGERTYEVANTLCNPVDTPTIVHSSERATQLAKHFAETLNLDANRILEFAFVHACCSVCWAEENKQDTSYAEETIRTLEQLVSL
ncbi:MULTISPECIES: aminoglycoside phosphotransferase family protein [Halocynthiibacter]|uniref:Streptomycin resistance protein n=1 Tax=Halocynthiibacter halioticoli TaxID=2986804 RepID=A0AAE3J0I0_9RHOB|nr:MULTISPECIES: aminoglycoside phosphotransferase family protein [Halocynthiibacter]MCV6824271.1 hypothetical protein [Halocynthiibacter halioticoli]MCW4057272.1 hypothetical protein [Halocynthiibacter sp. SDUM655004]